MEPEGPQHINTIWTAFNNYRQHNAFNSAVEQRSITDLQYYAQRPNNRPAPLAAANLAEMACRRRQPRSTPTAFEQALNNI